jgi:hypothetical protein
MDNSNISVNAPACSYASLGNYNGYTRRGIGHPQVIPTTVTGVNIVPDFGSGFGYNALTHGSAPSCAGYFDIQSAYGKTANKCNTQYVNRLCNK